MAKKTSRHESWMKAKNNLGTSFLLASALFLTVADGHLSKAAAAAEPCGLNALTEFERLPYLKLDTMAGGQSSFDRSGANHDASQFLYTDGTEQVLLDLQGPGTLYRMWFTGFDRVNDYIKVYFDGETSPRINMLLNDLFAGSNAPFLTPLVGNDAVSSGGFYCYLPLPFHRSIKIASNATASNFYYNLGYHVYSPDTSVTTWTGSEDSSAARTLWNNAGSDPKSDAGNVAVSNVFNLGAGATQTLLDVSGPRSISSIKLRIPGTEASAFTNAIDLLTNLWFRISFDNEPNPSVWAPVGSFFAIGHFASYATRALPVGMDASNNLYVYFPMPFASRAVVELVSHRASSTTNVVCEIKHKPFTDAFTNVGCFKATFHDLNPMPFGKSS